MMLSIKGSGSLAEGPEEAVTDCRSPTARALTTDASGLSGRVSRIRYEKWSESQAGREPGRQALIELLRSSRASGLARVPDVSACCPGPKTQHCSPCRSISSKPPLSQALILVHLPKMAIFPRSAAKLVPLVLLGVVRVQYIEPAAPCAAG